MTAIALSVVVIWAMACLGLRLRLHGRLLVVGTPLRSEDWVLRALGACWLPRVSLGLLIVQAVREPGVIVHVLRGLGGRHVLALVVAGAFRLCATATLWEQLRAVEVHRIHRLDLRPSLLWEMAFCVHVAINAIPYILWS